MYNASWCRRKFSLKRDAMLRFSCRRGWWSWRARPVNLLHGWVARSKAVENLCLLTFLLNHGCSIAFRLYATLILFLPSAFHPKFHGKKVKHAGLVEEPYQTAVIWQAICICFGWNRATQGQDVLLHSIIMKKLQILQGARVYF